MERKRAVTKQTQAEQVRQLANRLKERARAKDRALRAQGLRHKSLSQRMLSERKSVISQVNDKLSELITEITDAPVDVQPLTEMVISEALAAEMNMNAGLQSEIPEEELLEEELLEDEDEEDLDDLELDDDEDNTDDTEEIESSSDTSAETEQLTQVIEDVVQTAVQDALAEATAEEEEEKRGMHMRKPRRSKRTSARKVSRASTRKQTALLDALIKRMAEQDKAREIVVKAALDNQQAVRTLAEQVERLQQQMNTMAKQLAMRPRASMSPETVVSKDAARQMGVDENYVIDPVFGKLRAQS